MRLGRKALLAIGTGLVITLFVIASRPPDEADLQYVPPKPPMQTTPGANPTPPLEREPDDPAR
jgi:hypothetical protein